MARVSKRRDAGRPALVVVTTVAVLLAGCGSAASAKPGPSTAASTGASARPSATASPAPAVPAPWNDPATATGAGHLAPGSNPAALPGDLLIADKLNDRLIVVDPQGRVRWQFPRPGDLSPGQHFRIPDDAFFTPDGREIVATQEDNFAISVVDVATHRIVYTYGHPGVPGSAANYLDNPDDAMMLPDGYLIAPDIKNCRVLLIAPGSHAPAHVFGATTHACWHQPPAHFGSPNGAFPMADGNYLVTEINGDWVDEMSLSGTVVWSTHPPDVAYPSDTNEIAPNRYLTADYSQPGQVVIFDRSGRAIWRYRPAGAAALNHPSIALPLPNGDVLISDDFNDRVIVVDPRTGRVVWQYGHTGIAAASPGYLSNPDGFDLAPPYSLTGTHAATMGQS